MFRVEKLNTLREQPLGTRLLHTSVNGGKIRTFNFP